jgi:hypothetical protein
MLSNKKPLGHQRTMLGKRLVLEKLAPGEYEFTIYLHQSLSNFETDISTLDVSFYQSKRKMTSKNITCS